MTPALQHPRYRFDNWIATGGMGEVWRATDTLLDRDVAVKVLKREYADDAVLRARFAAEARHAAALQHPHVASLLDYGEVPVPGQEPLPCLVMELVDGQSLSALLSGGRALPAEVAADLIAQAAEGIEAAHAIGIVHRDVKPGNLLVTPTGQVKVTDFGVARAADAAPLTMTGHLIGTPHYLSPEQAEGGSATPSSDVYALGIVLFECLTGRKPFVGESPVATALMQLREPLPELPGTVPERLARIARIATAKDPAARFQSAGAMAAALRDQSPDTRSYLLPDPVPTAAPAAVEQPAGTPSEPSATGARPWRRPALLAGLLAAVVLGGAGFAALSGGPSSTPTGPADKAAIASAVEGVRVRAADYVGLPVAEAQSRLRRLGLVPRLQDRPNPGTEPSGTVAAVSPSGLLQLGSRVVLTVWTEPVAPEPSTPASEGPGGGPGKVEGPTKKGGNSGKAGSPGNSPGKQPGNSGGKGKGKGEGKGKGKGGNGGGNGKGGKR